ncbi:MAG: hypothetical protein IIZ13_14260 [Renibacterium sp.]|nr:hypothetical protein [Renibacterium sp.]
MRFGVVWYDEEFFAEKKDIYLDKRHLAMFSGYGADESEVEVRHFVLAAQANSFVRVRISLIRALTYL